MSTIVVGVDGSKESKNALRQAIEHARLRDAELRVVYTYDFKPSWRQYADPSAATREQMEAIQRRMQQESDEAREHAEALVDSLVEEASDTSVTVKKVVLQDHHPAEALVQQSRDAAMLVVGSRGRGGFTGLVLGSVSQQCLHHATCPVLVVPSRRAG